ncbi:hypothetical protein L1887_47189 [Cichorium endivia]|nr:hypothetical protein L1887_47189 [Cichorium endivia]
MDRPRQAGGYDSEVEIQSMAGNDVRRRQGERWGKCIQRVRVSCLLSTSRRRLGNLSVSDRSISILRWLLRPAAILRRCDGLRPRADCSRPCRYIS